MKLLTFTHQDTTRLGVLIGNSVVDLAAAVAAHQNQSISFFPTDMLALFLSNEEIWHRAKDAVAWLESATPEMQYLSLDEVKIEAPLKNPSKIICVGQNYYDHCREQNVPIPERPILFAKFSTCIVGPGGIISWTEGTTTQVDYEAELALVIKKVAKNVSKEHALEYLAGYTIANDISARDVQFGDKQWVRGKSFDTFLPLGPYIATTDEIPDPQNLTIKCRVNGQTLQDSNTLEMIFKVPDLIEFITRTTTLLPGDIIITGTPHGVGIFRNPPILLQDGDVVEVEIEGLGRLRNPVKVIA